MNHDQALTQRPAYSPFPAIVLAVLGLAPWLVMEWHKMFNHDIFWLMEELSRLWAGRTMAQAAYDANPPLSMLIYTPALALARLTGLPNDGAVFATTFFFSLLSTSAVWVLARRLIDPQAAFFLALAAFIAETLMAFPDFSERDHLLILGLLPFALAQYVATARLPVSPVFLAAVFSIGAVVILLKPDYGLLPVVLLLHRMIKQRRWFVIGDQDFIALALATGGVCLLTFFLFHDYVTQIFPDVVRLYLPGIAPMVKTRSWHLLRIYCLIFLLTLPGFSAAEKNLVRFFAIAAAICLIPYIVEGKNFSYHLLPTLTFFRLAAALYIFMFFRRIWSYQVASVAVIGGMLLVGYLSHPPFPTQAGINALPLTRLVASCGDNCRFMFFSENMLPIQMTSFAAGKPHVSRFPHLWFLGRMLQESLSPDAGAHYRLLYHKYAHYLAEDINRGKPDLAIACPQRFDFVRYFSIDPVFAQAWQPYRRTGSVPVNMSDYYPDIPRNKSPTMNCDVYRRF